MSDFVWPHRQQPTRLSHPWDSPGKNTGVGFHFLLQCMKMKSESEVAQLCLTLSDPMDCSLPGSSVRGIFQARVLEWGATKLNEQGDNIQPWHTPFPIWNQSVVSCPVLTVAFWSAYRFLGRHVFSVMDCIYDVLFKKSFLDPKICSVLTDINKLLVLLTL